MVSWSDVDALSNDYDKLKVAAAAAAKEGEKSVVTEEKEDDDEEEEASPSLANGEWIDHYLTTNLNAPSKEDYAEFNDAYMKKIDARYAKQNATIMKRAESRSRNAFLKHLEELKEIASDEKNWITIDKTDDVGKKIRVLVIRKSAGATRKLCSYVGWNFFGKTVEELQTHAFWNDIKDYNWQFRDKAMAMLSGTGNAKRARVDLSTIALPK